VVAPHLQVILLDRDEALVARLGVATDEAYFAHFLRLGIGEQERIAAPAPARVWACMGNSKERCRDGAKRAEPQQRDARRSRRPAE
jgi:hypothetical protein